MYEVLFNYNEGFILRRFINDSNWMKNKHRLCIYNNEYYWIPDYFIYDNDYKFFIIHIRNVKYDIWDFTPIIKKNSIYYKWIGNRFDSGTIEIRKFMCKRFIEINNLFNKTIIPPSKIFYSLYKVKYDWRNF